MYPLPNVQVKRKAEEQGDSRVGKRAGQGEAGPSRSTAWTPDEAILSVDSPFDDAGGSSDPRGPGDLPSKSIVAKKLTGK